MDTERELIDTGLLSAQIVDSDLWVRDGSVEPRLWVRLVLTVPAKGQYTLYSVVKCRLCEEAEAEANEAKSVFCRLKRHLQDEYCRPAIHIPYALRTMHFAENAEARATTVIQQM